MEQTEGLEAATGRCANAHRLWQERQGSAAWAARGPEGRRPAVPRPRASETTSSAQGPCRPGQWQQASPAWASSFPCSTSSDLLPSSVLRTTPPLATRWLRTCGASAPRANTTSGARSAKACAAIRNFRSPAGSPNVGAALSVLGGASGASPRRPRLDCRSDRAHIRRRRSSTGATEISMSGTTSGGAERRAQNGPPTVVGRYGNVCAPAGGAAEGSERTVRRWDARWRRGISCIKRTTARQLLDLHRLGEGVVLRLQQRMQR